MQWRISTWIFIFISGLLIDLSSGRGVLTIWLLNYKNVKGRTYDGSCCDNAPTGSDTCPDQCDYVMRCIVTGLGRANDHVFLFHRPIKYDSNDISFEDESSQMTQLTILFDEWPTTSSVKMDVFFYDYDDFDHTTVLVDWFETPLHRSVEKGEKQVEVVRGNRQMDKTRLEFKWSVHCFGSNDCLKPPPEWNIWPWASESKTQSNVDSDTHSVSSYYLHNVSKSMTTVHPTQTQKKTTVKIFNKNLDEQWVEADDTIDGNVIRSPFTPFNPHTQHGDILNGREKLLDAREHARIIDAEERFDVAPARQANPIDDSHKPLNAHKKKTHKGLNDNLIEPMPAIDDHFATDVPVVRDELLKEIYEKVAVELLSHDVKNDAEFSPADPSLRLQTIIAETEKKTGALPMPRNPYIDRNGEHIKLPNLGHSHNKKADDNSKDLSKKSSYPRTNLMNTAKPYTVFERISSTPQIGVESITGPTNDDESINTNTELPQKIPVVRKHRTKPPTVRKWDRNYDWKEHYKDYVLPKQHVSKVKTHVWSPKRPIKKTKGEPVSRTGAQKYPQSSLNRLKEARKNSSIEIGYYRQRHTDFINQKRRKEKAKIKTSKSRPITPRPKIKMSDTFDFTTEKAKKIPINVAPINPYVRKRKPYQAILKLNSGFTDWSKDLRTKLPPVNPSAKVPMAAPSVVKNNIIPGHFKNNIITSKNSNSAVADQFNGISKVKTTRVDVTDNVEKFINSKSISVGVSDYAKPVQNDIINGNNDIYKPKTHYVSDHIKPKTTSVIPNHVKTDIIKPKTSSVPVPHHVKTDTIMPKAASVAVFDHVKTDIIKPKTTSIDVPDHVKTDTIKPKATSVDVPDYVKTDIIKSKTTSVAMPDHVKTDNIKTKTTSVAVPDNAKTDISNPKTTSVTVHDHVKKDNIKSKTTSIVVPDHIKTDINNPKTTSVDVPDHVKTDNIKPKTTSVAVPDNVKKDISNHKTTSVDVSDHVKTDNIKPKTTSAPVPDRVVSARNPIYGDVIKSKPTDADKPELVKTGSVSTLDPIMTKTTKNLSHYEKVKYSDIIRPLQPPLKSRDKTQQIDKKKKLSDAPNSVSSDSHRNRVSKVFHENNRSSFSVGPFLPDMDTDERSKPKGTRSTTIHSWYVFDNKLLPESKQSSRRNYKDVYLETPKKTTYHRETIDTKLKTKSEDKAKSTKGFVDPAKYIQTSSIKEALEKLNPKKSPFYPKRKPVNSQSKPHQTTQVKTINKKIKKTGEVFISKSTSIPQKSTPKASKPTTVDIIQPTTIASFTQASGRDRLVVNLPLPPNIEDNVDSGPQIQGTPIAMRPKNSRNPTFNAILTPVPTKTTKSVHVNSKTNGLYINPVRKLTTNEVAVISGAITKSTETPVRNRFTPKDRGGLFETFKSLSEIIKQASRKDILKTNHTSIKATKVVSNVKKSPFSPNPVERNPIVSFTSSKSLTTIQWVKHSPKSKKEGKTTQSRFQITVKPMTTFGNTRVGPTSPSQSPVIVNPMPDVRATTTASQMNIFEFLPNAIKEIYFGKAKQPFLGIHDQMHTTASDLETVRSKPTAGRPFASNPDTPVGEKLNNDHTNQQQYRPFSPDLETQGSIATTKRPLSSDLDILDSLSNPDDHLKIDKHQKLNNPSVQVAPKDDRKGDILNYVYHDPKTELKGMNFLFNKKRFDPKNPLNTIKLPRPLKPTTRYRRPQIPALASHKYFAYTRVGPAGVFTTTPATTKRMHRFKLPALPTHRYFAYTRKDVPTTTKQPTRNHFGSFIERGKVKLVSKQGTRKSPIGFENKISKHTTKTGSPNSAASKTFNPYNQFKSNTPSPRFPTKFGDRKSDSSRDDQTVTKHPVATQNEKGTTGSHIHPVEPDISRSSQTSQSKHPHELVNRGQSTTTTTTGITEKTNEVREHKQSTKSVNKFTNTAPDPSLRINHQQSSGATITEDIRRTKSSEQSTATPVTIQRESLQTEDSLNRKSYETTDNLQISSNASHQRPTASGNAGETPLETNRRVTITSDIFRWIYDLSKSLPEINKPVSKSNTTMNLGAPNIKDNGTSIATDTKESNIFNPFINMFFNLTNTIAPKTNLNRTKHVSATGGKYPSVEEATISTGSPTQYPSSSHGSSPQTKEIWYKDVAVLTNKENEDIKRKIVEQSISQKTTKSDSLDRTKTLLTNKPKSTLKSTVTTEATSLTLGPKKVLTTTLTPFKLIPSKATSEKTFKNITSESSNKPKGTVLMTSKPVAMTTTKVMVTHTDEQSTTPSSSTTQARTTITKTTPKKIELTIPPWLNITTPLRPNKTEMTIISTQPEITTEKLSKITTMQPEKPTTKKPKQTTANNPKKITTEKHQKPTTTKKKPKKPTSKKPKTKTTKKVKTTKKPKKPTTKKPKTKTTKKVKTTKNPKKPTTKKPKTKTTKKVKTTKKPKKPTTKKPKAKTTKKVKLTTTKSPKTTTASTTAKTRQSTTTSLPRTRKPVNITINVDPNSNDGPRIIVPNGGLFIPQPREYNSSSYGYPGGLARLQVRKMNFKTVFNRYWPAILGLTVGTVFLVAAVLTSVACRQQRLYIRRSGWTDMPHHVSEPPDTSEYSSAASLVSDATRSSISFQ